MYNNVKPLKTGLFIEQNLVLCIYSDNVFLLLLISLIAPFLVPISLISNYFGIVAPVYCFTLWLEKKTVFANIAHVPFPKICHVLR